MRMLGWGLVATTLLAWTQAANAGPDSYTPLGKKFDVPVTLTLMPGKVDVTVRLSLGSAIEEKVGGLYLQAESDLSELKNKAQSIVGDKPLTDSCADVVTVTNVSLVSEGTHATLCGTVNYEHWLCPRARHETFSGRSTTYSDTAAASDRLSTDSGELCAAIWPEPGATNKSLVVKHEVTKNELGPRLASLTPPVDVADIVFGKDLPKALAGLTGTPFPTPKPLAKYNLSVLDAAFGPGQNGGLVLTARELVPVPEDKLADLIVELLSLGSGAGT